MSARESPMHVRGAGMGTSCHFPIVAHTGQQVLGSAFHLSSNVALTPSCKDFRHLLPIELSSHLCWNLLAIHKLVLTLIRKSICVYLVNIYIALMCQRHSKNFKIFTLSLLQSDDVGTCIVSVYRWGNRGTRRFSNLCKVIRWPGACGVNLQGIWLSVHILTVKLYRPLPWPKPTKESLFRKKLRKYFAPLFWQAAVRDREGETDEAWS